MIDSLTMQVKLSYFGNKKLKNDIYTGNINLEKRLFDRGKFHYGFFFGKIDIYGIFFDSFHAYIFVNLHPSELLKRMPTEKDVITIEKNVINLATNELKVQANEIELLNLNRIDYNADFRVKNEEERKIIYELMKEASDRFNNVLKISTDTSIRYKSKKGYIEFIVYDKEHEVIEKNYFKGTEEEFIKKYKNVIRTEIRIKNRKLNYNKNTLHIDKILVNYLNKKMANYYFDNYVSKIFFKETFYRIDVAVAKIKSDKTLSVKMKEKLSSLLILINSLGFTKAKTKYSSKYSLVTFRDHIKRIRKLGINPLTFSSKFNIEQLKNFSLRKDYFENECIK